MRINILESLCLLLCSALHCVPQRSIWATVIADAHRLPLGELFLDRHSYPGGSLAVMA